MCQDIESLESLLACFMIVCMDIYFSHDDFLLHATQVYTLSM